MSQQLQTSSAASALKPVIISADLFRKGLSMETMSSVVLAIAFLSGASVGALFTAAVRYASRNAILNEFQNTLTAIVEEQEEQRVSLRAVASSQSPDDGKDESPREDFDEVENEEELAWIAARPVTTRTDSLHV